MGSWRKREDALYNATANAQADGKPRYVHYYNGRYWVGKTPLSPMGESQAGIYYVVRPDGRVEDRSRQPGGDDVRSERPPD